MSNMILYMKIHTNSQMNLTESLQKTFLDTFGSFSTLIKLLLFWSLLFLYMTQFHNSRCIDKKTYHKTPNISPGLIQSYKLFLMGYLRGAYIWSFIFGVLRYYGRAQGYNEGLFFANVIRCSKLRL